MSIDTATEQSKGQRYLFRNQMALTSATRHSCSERTDFHRERSDCRWFVPFLLWISRNICANKQPKHAYGRLFFGTLFLTPFLPGMLWISRAAGITCCFFPCAARKMKLKKKINHHFFPHFFVCVFSLSLSIFRFYIIRRSHSACVLKRIFNFMAKGSISCFTAERTREMEAMAWEVN